MPTGIYQHRPLSEETKRKIGSANRGRKFSDKFREKMRLIKLGKKFSQETRLKMSLSHKGKKPIQACEFNKGKSRPEWVKKKISESDKLAFVSGKRIPWDKGTKGIVKPTLGSFKKGHIPWCKGKKMECTTGVKHPNWKGGISKIEYGEAFNLELKKMIKARDNYQCRLCGKTKYKLHIHHIDYNKKNNIQQNLVSLCESCHYKTFYHREDWIKKFTAMLSNS